jgi:ATP-binding cassette subfamily B protein
VLLVLTTWDRGCPRHQATVGEIGFLRGFWMDGSRRLAWLEDYAATLAATANTTVRPTFATAFGWSTCRSPIRDRRVSCWTMSGASARRRGRAIVSESAGKTTLVKLIARM